MISRQLAAARGAAVPPAAVPTTQTGLNDMTPAQQRAELRRQAVEQRRLQREAERYRKAQAKAAAAEERARRREREMYVREGSKVLRSRAGQSALRSVFDVFFGGRRR
jgi:zona occludens toxin (predicted ATPase)